MKTLRALFLLGALAAVAFVVRDYQTSRQSSAAFAGLAPAEISADLASQSGAWTWEQSSADAAKVLISADGFRQSVQAGGMDLTGVLLRVFDPEGRRFDRIETDSATFDIAADLFRSNVETTITLGVPADSPDAVDASLTRITAHGAEFDTKAGAARTDGETLYRFEGGRGRSVGASYDSARKYFHMKSAAEVEWFPSSPGGEATMIRAGELYYLEADQRVDLRGGATLDRGAKRIEADEATITLEQGLVRQINALNARGVDTQVGRTVTFRTPKLDAFYGDLQTIERIVGEGDSELVSASNASRTRATGSHMDLRYKTPPGAHESVLDEAFVRGGAAIETRSTAGALRRVRSEWIRLQMQPGGQDVALLETLERGRADILPGGEGAPRRLDADRIRADYSVGNRMERLTANGDVRLRSGARAPGAELLETWSGALTADFDPASGELTELRQWNQFRFTRGDRTGAAQEALYTPAGGRMELTGKARVKGATGSIAGHRIILAESDDRILAEGDVATVYAQSSGSAGDESAGLFAPSKPVYATALAMTSDQATGIVEYRGQARLWQGANRVEADLIRIDRAASRLHAEGAVVTFLMEQGETPAGGRLVVVRSERLDYAETDRTARYRGRVRLERDDLTVAAAELDARMAEASDDSVSEKSASRIETAEARGAVVIADTKQGRRGLAERAVYHPGDGKVELFGEPGKPATALNAQGEQTRGAKLTYLIDGDSLHVSGGGEGRAYTFRRRDR